MSQFADWFESNHGSCIVKSATGVDCPGCGAQRGFTAFFRGDLAGAWEHYPPLFMLLIALVVIALVLILRHRRRNFYIRWAGFLTLGAIMLNYIVNIALGNAW